MANLAVNLAKSVINYTKNGARLVSKTTNGNTRIAIVETDFGKGLKTISQTFNDEGKLTSTSILYRKNGKDVSSLKKNYTRNNDEVNISTTFSEGLKTSNTEEMQILVKELDGTKSMLRRKFTQTPIAEGSRGEEQAYEYLTNAGNKDKYRTLYTTAVRSKDGQVINKTVSGNLQNLDEIANDPYLYIRNYSGNDFVESASYIAAANQGVSRGNLEIKKLNGSCGLYMHVSKTVKIDPSALEHVLVGKSGLVDTLNHEYRHKYQYSQMGKTFKQLFNIFRSDKNRIKMTPGETKQALSFMKGEILYRQPKSNFEKYYNNILEVDARKAGSIAESAYKDYSLKFAKAFDGEEFAEIFGCSSSPLARWLKKAKTVNINLKDLLARAAKTEEGKDFMIITKNT